WSQKRRGKHSFGLAWMNLASGRFNIEECDEEMLDALLSRIEPAELLHAESQSFNELLPAISHAKAADWHFELDSARHFLLEHFRIDSLASFGIEDLHLAICAAGALLPYDSETQSSDLRHIQHKQQEQSSEFVILDSATPKNLELTNKLSCEDQPTLFSVIDHCCTPMGARLLRRWVHHPL